MAAIRIAEQESSLYKWRDDWTEQVYDKRELVKKTVNQWDTYQEYLEMAARYRALEDSGFDTDKYPDYPAAPCQLNSQEQACHRNAEEVVGLVEGLLSDMDARMKGEYPWFDNSTSLTHGQS